MKVYIAGRISGDPSYREKFSDAEMGLRRRGHAVLNPAMLRDGFTQAEYMRICLAMIDCVDAVYFLPDWTCSEGARVERAYCLKIGKTILDFVKLGDEGVKGLADELAGMDPDTVVHLGSKSSFIAVAPAGDMLAPGYLDALSETWLRAFRAAYHSAVDFRDMTLRNCTDPEKIEEAEARVSRAERNIQSFVPFTQRAVRAVYERFQKDGVVLLVEGEECGSLWDVPAKQRSGESAK